MFKIKSKKLVKSSFFGGAVVLAMGLVVGCGSGNHGNGGSNQSSSTPGKPKKITFLTQDTSTTSYKVVITQLSKAYEKQYPNKINFNVNFVPQTSENQKLELLASSKKLPNMYDIGNPSLEKKLINSGQALNLEPILKKLGIYNKLLPSALKLEQKELGMTSGIYDLPLQLNIEGFWFNKQMFKKYNLKVPTTWTQMLSDAKVLKAHGIQPFAVDGKDGWPLTRYIGGYALRYYGANAMKDVKDGKLKLTDPGFIKAAQVIQTMGKDGYFGKGVSTVDYNTALNEFLQGKAAMYYMGSWILGDFNNKKEDKIGAKNIGLFNIPLVKGGKGNLSTWEMNTGGQNQFSKTLYSPAEGKWMKYVFSNFGKKSMDEYGDITGWKVKKMPPNAPALTKSTIKTISKVKTGALWFEARFTTKGQEVSQQQVQLLVTGSLSPKQYMSQLQTANGQ